MSEKRSRAMATEDRLWIPPLSPKDQQKLDRLRSKGKKSTSNWTGFAGRTLWDWIQFFAVLAIPIIVAAGTVYFTLQITLQQAQLSIAASEKQHQTDIQIAQDQQQEATLNAYLNDMTTLLLDKKLGSPAVTDKAASAEAAVVARVKTLTVLRRLTDPQRKARVVQFLYEAHLIGYFASYPFPTLPYSLIGPIIYLFDADLRGADLQGTTLNGTDLR